MNTAHAAIAPDTDHHVRHTVSALFNPLVKQAHARVDAGTRWGLSVSTVLHALLFTWLILLWRPEPAVPPITEITYLEPGDLDGPALARSGSSAAPASAPGQLAPGDQDVHFRRESRPSELNLDPSPGALEDRLNARLAALQGDAGAPSAGLVASAPPSLWGSTPATVSGSGSGGTSPVALKRGGAGAAPSLELTRGGRDLAPALVATPAPAERAQSQAPAKGGESTARRTLAGATIMGPIADRAILAHTTPVYPEWAKREAVEGSVTLYFVVRADGSVKENILVQKTAGFEEFDENARAALAAWRFEPLRDGRAGEQWGNITFHFRLRGGS
jgi:TonB family protein